MVVTTAYALLFGALRFTPSPPILFAVVAGFITCVGIAQALLFGGKKPRMSSALVGVVWLFGLLVTTGAIRLVYDYPSSVIALAILGAFIGYVAGVVVGSVFLTSDMLRKSIQRCKSR